MVFRDLTCQRIWFFVFCGSFLAGMRNGGKKFWAALFAITRKESSASAGGTSRRTDATAAWLAHYFPNLGTIGVWVMSSHVILVKTLIGSVPILITRRWWPRIKQNRSVFLKYLNASWKGQWFTHPKFSHRTLENANTTCTFGILFFSPAGKEYVSGFFLVFNVLITFQKTTLAMNDTS